MGPAMPLVLKSVNVPESSSLKINTNFRAYTGHMLPVICGTPRTTLHKVPKKPIASVKQLEASLTIGSRDPRTALMGARMFIKPTPIDELAT